MELERVALEIPQVSEISIDPLRKQLADKAATVLGYGGLGQHLNESSRAVSVTHDVAQVFQELDIKPFTPESVEKYKKQEQKRMQRKSFMDLPGHVKVPYLMDRFYGSDPEPLAVIGAVLAIGGLVMAIVCVAGLFIDGWNHTEKMLLGWGSPLYLWTALTAWGLIANDSLRGYGVIRNWSWEMDRIERSSVPIPDFAIDTAIRVKEKLPYVDIYVDALTDRDQILGDPFLAVKANDQYYYVEVWNEARFEAMQRKA